MKKYLIQFCEELEASTGALGDFTPQYIPTKGITAEFSHEKLSNFLETTFDKFPRYHIAIVSEMKAGKKEDLELSEFQFIAVNKEWNGNKAKGCAVDIPVDIFKMMV